MALRSTADPGTRTNAQSGHGSVELSVAHAWFDVGECCFGEAGRQGHTYPSRISSAHSARGSAERRPFTEYVPSLRTPRLIRLPAHGYRYSSTHQFYYNCKSNQSSRTLAQCHAHRRVERPKTRGLWTTAIRHQTGAAANRSSSPIAYIGRRGALVEFVIVRIGIWR